VAPNEDHAPNGLHRQFATRQALELISDRWTMIVVKALAEGIHRYGALHREIGGISQKMLTQTLRALERDGLVERTVYPVVPPMVEYALTPLGATLIDLLTAVAVWAEQHMDDVTQARAAHEAAKRLPASHTPAFSTP
jgi:DNA-binding HxlR family transcriptional regulator